ncbi:MAG: flagellar FlbD family protein [Clostridiales bacterium]|nr:flagellar FlbD family protein [Clostridiales bacterium]
MIKVTRINGKEEFYVNENQIEFIEETPDTVISLESGKKVVVMESAEEIIRRIAAYKALLCRFREKGEGSLSYPPRLT